MDNTFYVTLSRQTALFRKMDVIANNIANANTTAYKAEKMLFTDFVKKNSDKEKISFAYDVATIRDATPGELERTGSNFDVAIKDKGYFIVETPHGQMYTRAGNFTKSSSGLLVNADGYPVKSKSGESLTIPEGALDFSIREDGMVQVFVDGTLEQVGQIGVVDFASPRDLSPMGQGLFKGENPIGLDSTQYYLVQGSIEKSNVNPVHELTQLIEVSRSIGSNAKMLDDLRDMLSRAIEIISRQS